MGLEQYIPFEDKKFRPGQEDAIKKVISSIEDGNRYTVLNAPVGSGKSLIGYVIAKYLEEFNDYTYLCTGTKILQSQYIEDFKDVKTIKGRVNFGCLEESLFNCDKGMCQTRSKYKCSHKPVLKENWEYDGETLPTIPLRKNNGFSFYGDPEFDSHFLYDMCPYWEQKIKGIMSPITMLNYDYLISDARFVQHLPHRKFLVCDEGHNIEKILMRQLESTFSPFAVRRDTGFDFKISYNIEDWIDQFETVAGIYKDKAKLTKSDQEKKKVQEKYSKFSLLHFLLESDPLNWVFIPEKKNGHQFFTFKPIMVSKYTNFIFGIADNVLIMSGTILKKDIFERDLGIENSEYIEIPSVIPSERRPIVKSYVGPMSMSYVDATMPKMIQRIQNIADRHHNEKGVIHTFTYKIANEFEKAFWNDDGRFMFHNQKNKEAVFEEFKKDGTNKILVSPVAFEGVDFPYDQARWQCICKEPFPNMRDPQISVRDQMDYDWIFRQRCLVLSQMYGRTNRAEDDYSVTYLLDSRLESLLGPASLVTDYFLEALDGFRYEDEFIIEDDAYQKLTKDNSRKNHEFDREVERNILHDIEDGYNSLSLLRREYKKFPSDAYKYITPGVERLLKHKAIRYKE